MQEQSLFRSKEFRGKSQYRSVNSLRKEVAREYRVTVGRVLHTGNRELFVPFVNERRLGKLVLEPLSRKLHQESQLQDDQTPCTLFSKPRVTSQAKPNKPIKKWTLNSVSSRQLRLKPFNQTQPEELLQQPSQNLYEKTNLLVYREIKNVEPPESVSLEDKNIVKSLYESYKHIKEFTENIRRKV